MDVRITETAEKELDEMEGNFRNRFLKNLQKLRDIPPRRHMRFGLPYNVENVTKQARIVYEIEDETIFILHCFRTHKEYEKWYKGFK